MPQHPAPVLTNVTILGAGAMGCYFAGRLIEGGLAVTLVDVSAERVDALNARGLTVIDQGGERTIAATAVLAGALEQTPDLVIVFTKSQHTRAAIQSLAGKLGPETWVLTLQNGLGAPEQIASVVAPERILVGVTDVPADFQPPTTVTSHGDGKIRFWDHLKQGPPFLAALDAAFARAGLHAAADPAVEVAIWEKVAFNAALNALTSILRKPVGALDTAEGRRLIDKVVSEAVQVAGAVGVGVDRARIDERIAHALAHHAGHAPSMLQDVLAGRPTEIGAINGAIVAAGLEVGVAAPVNATLASLVEMQT